MDPFDKQEILEAIKDSHQTTYHAFHDLFENSIKGFSSQLAQFEERNSEQHHQITLRQDITNGRVTSLEKETAVFRWCARNPKLAVVLGLLVIIGIITLGVVVGIENLVSIVP
jgi:hypothetical protein